MGGKQSEPLWRDRDWRGPGRHLRGLWADAAKENDSDEIQIKYVKNLIKNLDTYNNKEILSKVEKEIMYINNLKQKQKYLEKLKNKLIKLEKKENSTSIFSKLFRR